MNLRTIRILCLTLGLTTLSLNGEASEPLNAEGPGESVPDASAPRASNPAGTQPVGRACPLGQVTLIDQVPNQVSSSGSDSSCGFCSEGAQSIADDFVMTVDASVAQVVIWGIYFDSSILPDPLAPFTVILHEDLQGRPGPVVASQSLPPTSATETGMIVNSSNEFMFIFDLDPVALTAGTYWIEIFTDTTGSTDTFAWEHGALDASRGRVSAAFSPATPGNTWTIINPPNEYSMIVCATTGEELFSDGFDSGNTSAWSLTFPAP